MTFSRVAVIVTITAVLVYLGLNLLLPRNQKEKAETAGVSAEEVFGGAAAPADVAAGTTPTPDAAPAAATDSATPPPAEPAAEASAPAPEAAPAAEAAPTTETATADTSTAAPAEAAAPAPAAEPAAAPATADAQGLSDEEARKIAENVSTEVATRVAESATPVQDSGSMPADSSSSSTATTSGGLTEADVRRIATEAARKVFREERGGRNSSASASSSSSHTSSASASEPSAAPAKAAKPKPEPSSEVASSSAPAKGSNNQKRNTRPGASIDAVSAWWPASAKQSSDHLNLVFAGEASYEKAVVLLFGSDLGDAAAASSNIEVLNSKGAPAGGQWSAGTTPRLLVYKGVKPGRYTVILKPSLADGSGKTLASQLEGPVYVH